MAVSSTKIFPTIAAETAVQISNPFGGRILSMAVLNPTAYTLFITDGQKVIFSVLPGLSGSWPVSSPTLFVYTSTSPIGLGASDTAIIQVYDQIVTLPAVRSISEFVSASTTPNVQNIPSLPFTTAIASASLSGGNNKIAYIPPGQDKIVALLAELSDPSSGDPPINIAYTIYGLYPDIPNIAQLPLGYILRDSDGYALKSGSLQGGSRAAIDITEFAPEAVFVLLDGLGSSRPPSSIEFKLKTITPPNSMPPTIDLSFLAVVS